LRKQWQGNFPKKIKEYVVRNLEIEGQPALLDVGCANGDLLAKLYDQYDFYGTGLDISEEMIELAKEKHPAFNFFVGAAEQLPFPDDAYDILVCSASFHHFSDPLKFLREAERVLRPDGTLVIAEIRIPLYDLRKLYNKRLDKQTPDDEEVKVYSQRELEDLFDEAEFYMEEQKNTLQIQYYELKKR